TLSDECFWIGHLQNSAERHALVDNMLIVRLDDPVPNPVAKITRLVHCAVVKPFGKIGLVFIGDERSLDFFFISPSPSFELGRRDLAGNQLGRKLGSALDQGCLKDCGMLVVNKCLYLLNMGILMCDQ